jgi:hypothetical protein
MLAQRRIARKLASEFLLKPFDFSGVLRSNHPRPALNNMKKIFTVTLALAFGSFAIAIADDTNNAAAPVPNLPPASTKTGVTFDADIKPIFDAACMNCHDSKKPKQSAKLSLDTLQGVLKGDRDGAVIKPGDSAHSDLVMVIAHIGDPMTFMPKGRGAKKLTDDQIGLIRAWIDQGAK